MLTASGDDTPSWLAVGIHFLISDSSEGPGVGGPGLQSTEKQLRSPVPQDSLALWVKSRSSCPEGLSTERKESLTDSFTPHPDEDAGKQSFRSLLGAGEWSYLTSLTLRSQQFNSIKLNLLLLPTS